MGIEGKSGARNEVTFMHVNRFLHLDIRLWTDVASTGRLLNYYLSQKDINEDIGQNRADHPSWPNERMREQRGNIKTQKRRSLKHILFVLREPQIAQRPYMPSLYILLSGD